MTAKEYLSQLRRYDRMIESKKAEIERIRLSLEYKSVSYDGQRVQGGGASREDMICKMLDFERDMEDQVRELIELKKEIMAQIDKLDQAEYIQLLYLRYLEFKTWEEISVKMNFSYRYVLKLHGRALQELEKKLKVDTKRHIEQ